MGKKSRLKKEARHLPLSGKKSRPDEYMQCGPFELARVGRATVMRNRMSQEQLDALQIKLIDHLPDVVREIDTIISQIALKISHLQPEELLHRAYWALIKHNLKMQNETELGQDALISLRMIDYVQSVIASVLPAEFIQSEATDHEWQELRSWVEKLFTKLNAEFFPCQAALRKQACHFNSDLEEYFVKTQMYWCNVRGQRYSILNLPFLQDFISPHEEVFKELYGIGTQDLVVALGKIQHALTFGIGDANEERIAFETELLSELETRGISASMEKMPDPSVITNIMEEKGWVDRSARIAARLWGMSLHDVEDVTNLPKTLLEDLSWSQGEDKDFFSEGQYQGWPLREWPVRKRPFLKLKGKYYCFDNYSLFDNIYRVIQRAIRKRKPGYAVSWNEKQQEVSERVPIELFKKLLPKAQVFRSVHYRWHTGSSGKKNWCEADAFLIYEDHLIVVEVRGGAFTHTSPTIDFGAHFESLRNLIEKPAEQGGRFVSYLESANSVKFYDQEHVEMGTISRNQFEHITICAVTLDPFTEMASRTQHFKKLGIELGPRPTWSLSVDDLRVYTEIFDNPLLFLHFIEERMRAAKLDTLETEDELDHLGLYLKHNIYTHYLEGIGADGPVRWHGYRVDIDKFFTQRLTAPNTPCSLRQRMPERIEEILFFLGKSQKIGRRKLASSLLNCSGKWRNKIANAIDEELKRQFHSKKPQYFSIHGELRITVLCWQTELGMPDRQDAVAHARAIVIGTNEPDRLLLQLGYSDRKLVDIEYDFLSLGAIPAEDISQLKLRAETLTQQRLNKAQLHPTGIGRNQICPCGSGRKYKKCHGS